MIAVAVLATANWNSHSVDQESTSASLLLQLLRTPSIRALLIFITLFFSPPILQFTFYNLAPPLNVRGHINAFDSTTTPTRHKPDVIRRLSSSVRHLRLTDSHLPQTPLYEARDLATVIFPVSSRNTPAHRSSRNPLERPQLLVQWRLTLRGPAGTLTIRQTRVGTFSLLIVGWRE